MLAHLYKPVDHSRPMICRNVRILVLEVSTKWRMPGLALLQVEEDEILVVVALLHVEVLQPAERMPRNINEADEELNILEPSTW